MTLEPIGLFHAESKYPYEARRQASVDHRLGEVLVRKGLEQALEDLEGFDRIWLIYQFHHNPDWKPKVMPPRGPRTKRGVFATRAPYRPNALGLSCVRLVKVDGLRVVVEGHDLLDGTPVFDIKPYLPYADAFPDSRVGWLESVEAERWSIEFSAVASEQLDWLEENGVTQLRTFVQAQLEFDPVDHKRKRIEKSGHGYILSYRTWRVNFVVTENLVKVQSIESGYTDLAGADPYGDKEVHRQYMAR